MMEKFNVVGSRFPLYEGGKILGRVVDLSEVGRGLIRVRPCFFPRCPKDVAVFLRDAKREGWARADNLRDGVRVAFTLAFDEFKGPMAVDVETIPDGAPVPAGVYAGEDVPVPSLSAESFRRLIELARSNKAANQTLIKGDAAIDKVVAIVAADFGKKPKKKGGNAR